MRGDIVNAKVSQAEKELIQAVAAAAGVTVSEWIRASAIEAARDWLRQRGVAQEPEGQDVRVEH